MKGISITVVCSKYKNNLREERFILAMVIKGLVHHSGKAW